jgi:exodeoxyribonuclease V
MMAHPDVRLENIHRQAADNPVIQLAHMVRMGLPMSTLIDFIKETKDDRLRHVVADDLEAMEYAEQGGVMITHTNKHRAELNAKFRRICMRIKVDSGPVDGERFLCVKNYYFPDRTLFANGSTGKVVTVHGRDRDAFNVLVDLEDDNGPIPLRLSAYQWGQEKTYTSFQDIPSHPKSWNQAGILCDYGYGITCHKSQGSSYSHVAVYVKKSLNVMSAEDRNRWLYTSFTRSSDKLLVVT